MAGVAAVCGTDFVNAGQLCRYRHGGIAWRGGPGCGIHFQFFCFSDQRRGDRPGRWHHGVCGAQRGCERLSRRQGLYSPCAAVAIVHRRAGGADAGDFLQADSPVDGRGRGILKAGAAVSFDHFVFPHFHHGDDGAGLGIPWTRRYQNAAAREYRGQSAQCRRQLSFDS